MKNVKSLLTLGIVTLLCIMTTIPAQASSETSAQNKASVSFRIVDETEGESGGGEPNEGDSGQGNGAGSGQDGNNSSDNGENTNNNGGSNGNNNGEFPQTGEFLMLGVMILGLLLSGMGLIFLIRRRKNTKYTEVDIAGKIW